jgi:hypothetical protein
MNYLRNQPRAMWSDTAKLHYGPRHFLTNYLLVMPDPLAKRTTASPRRSGCFGAPPCRLPIRAHPASVRPLRSSRRVSACAIGCEVWIGNLAGRFAPAPFGGLPVAQRSAGKPVRRVFRRPAAAPPPGYAGTKAIAGHQWRQRIDRGRCHGARLARSSPQAGCSLRFAPTVTAPLSVADCMRRDEGAS